MDHRRFDDLTSRLAAPLSRRQGLGLVAALGLGAGLLAEHADARKHRKKKKKVTLNDFGCVDIGRYCSNGGQCCSGVCSGKRGKKTCQNHNATTCQNGVAESGCGATVDVTCITSSGAEGVCDATTGKGAYCAGDGGCFECKKDADCVPVCGPLAACIPCAGLCPLTGGTGCVGFGKDSCAALN